MELPQHNAWEGKSRRPHVLTSRAKQRAQERHAVFHSELVSMAYMLAAKAHAGQLRKDGSSQLSHAVMTALRLAELGLDAETVAAGLLHEVRLPAGPSSALRSDSFPLAPGGGPLTERPLRVRRQLTHRCCGPAPGSAARWRSSCPAA